MALIGWIITNVASILLPFELSPGFFQIGYALPVHEVYHALTDIWSGGCNPQLHYALPVLFFWELFGLITSGLGTFRRCHYATLAEEAQDKLFRERVKVAMDLRRETAQKVAPVASAGENLTSPSTDEGTGNVADSEEDRNEPAQVRKKAKKQGRWELRRLSTTVSFSPSFGLPCTQQDSADSA